MEFLKILDFKKGRVLKAKKSAQHVKKKKEDTLPPPIGTLSLQKIVVFKTVILIHKLCDSF